MTKASVDAILEEIKEEISTAFDHRFAPDAIQVDADIFEAGDALVPQHEFDSIDLVEVVAALEDRFETEVATLVTGDQPVTLKALARHIANSRA